MKKIFLIIITIFGFFSVPYFCANPNSIEKFQNPYNSVLYVESEKIKVNISNGVMHDIVFKDILEPYSKTPCVLLNNTSLDPKVKDIKFETNLDYIGDHKGININYNNIDFKNGKWSVLNRKNDEITLCFQDHKNNNIITRHIKIKDQYKIDVQDAISYNKKVLDNNAPINKTVSFVNNDMSQQNHKVFLNLNNNQYHFYDSSPFFWIKNKLHSAFNLVQQIWGTNKANYNSGYNNYFGVEHNKLFLAIKESGSGIVEYGNQGKHSALISKKEVSTCSNTEIICGPTSMKYLGANKLINVRQFGFFSLITKPLCIFTEELLGVFQNSILGILVLILLYFMIMLLFLLYERKKKAKIEILEAAGGNSVINIELVIERFKLLFLNLIKMIFTLYICISYCLNDYFNLREISMFWVKDFSIPEPYSLFNLYGYLNYKINYNLNFTYIGMFFLVKYIKLPSSDVLKNNKEIAGQDSTFNFISNIMMVTFLMGQPFALPFALSFYALFYYIFEIVESKKSDLDYYQV